MNRRAEHAPPARRMRSPQEMIAELELTLQKEYSLQMLPEFVILVEGWTDVSYLNRAAEVLEGVSGHNPLAVPDDLETGGSLIQILTPGSRVGPQKGGVAQLVRLAETLKPYVFTLDMFRGLVFVFDHDDAGIQAAEKVRNMGYGGRVLTLNPQLFPGACAKKQVVIEDLLSLEIQCEFFEQGNAWCSVEYEAGTTVRFDWHHNSKNSLRDYVCANSTWQGIKEIARLLIEARKAVGLPYSEAAFQK